LRITIIAAVDKHRCIGSGGQLPWRLGSDLRGFKQRTLEGTVVMGRRTFDSIGRPLPRRRNIVLSRRDDWAHRGVERAASVEEVLEMCSEEGEMVIIGGADIYHLFLEQATRMELSEVDVAIEGGDVHFPPFDEEEWTVVSTGPLIQEHDDEHPYRIVIRERRDSAE